MQYLTSPWVAIENINAKFVNILEEIDNKY